MPKTRPNKSLMRFDSNAFEPHRRLEAFERKVYGNWPSHPSEAHVVSLSASNENYNQAERYDGNNIYMSRLRTSGYSAGPKAAMTHHVVVNTCLCGGTQFGSERIGDGDIFINLSRNCQRHFGPGEYSRHVFSRNLLSGFDKPRSKLLVYRRDDPVAQIIASAARGVEDAFKTHDIGRLKIVEELMITVMQRILESALTPQLSSGYSHVRDRATEYIRDNIHRADLSVAEVASYTHVSRATLYRAFESVGGLKHFISDERISVAKSMLRLGHTHRGQISNVAYRSGFTSPEHFSRVFKTHTGLTPTQFIKNA